MPPTRLGPKGPDHPTLGTLCPMCGEEIGVGETFTVLFGPGGDPEQRAILRAGQQMTSPTALEMHWACVTGQEDAPQPEPSRIVVVSG
jgi:hypothetical protein